jgi:hypothetical protein
MSGFPLLLFLLMAREEMACPKPLLDSEPDSTAVADSVLDGLRTSVCQRQNRWTKQRQNR